MSTEIDELKKRVASLEKEFHAVFGKAETAEPAPGSDAEHPPVGYVLVPRGSGEVIAADWIVWSFDRGPWRPLSPNSVGDRAHSGFHPLARPIPANEGDSRSAESVAIPTEPARDLSAEVEKKAESLCVGCKRTLCGIDSRKTSGTVTVCANRIPSDSERMELRATVERLEAELETTKRLLAESLVERDRLKDLNDARKVRIEGFRDILRERLGDLV